MQGTVASRAHPFRLDDVQALSHLLTLFALALIHRLPICSYLAMRRI
jgi:hypothetical protein